MPYKEGSLDSRRPQHKQGYRRADRQQHARDGAQGDDPVDHFSQILHHGYSPFVRLLHGPHELSIKRGIIITAQIHSPRFVA